MGKIIVLDESSINKIAAGEVIERPLSIVKELVENSIDAGASKITVEIKNGGISLIKVTDDGKGIDPDDVELAFERHATGKIRSADDLPKVMTMGFRGEALSSIAAVSETELFSRTIDNEFGMNVFIKGGNISRIVQVGCPVGTSISVKNLFFNTPARYKFLKKDTTEAGYISDIMTRLALSSPHISFKFISNGATLIHTPGNNDLASTIHSIYRREISQNLISTEYKDEKFSITGYVGGLSFVRGNRSHQSLFVNNRFVKNKTVTAAIDEAYKTQIMKNKYAFTVLKIDVNPLMIDVNVHPNKMEIKFSEEGDLFRSVFHAINNALSKNLNIREFSQPPTQENKTTPGKILIQNELENDHKRIKENIETIETINENTPKSIKPNIYDLNYFPSNNSHNINENTTEYSSENINAYKNIIANEESINQPNNLELITQPEEEKSNYFEQLLNDGIVIGQLFLTYIIVQFGDELVLIDQHAAHERIRYEKLLEDFDTQELHGQNLITPEIIEVNPNEKSLIFGEKEFISSLGFEIEDFGQNSIIIRQIPLIELNCSPSTLFKDILDKIEQFGDRAKLKSKEILYDIACKGAIKANKKLDVQEILQLIRGLSILKTASTCPHGRPIILKMTKHFIEKEFKRIV